MQPQHLPAFGKAGPGTLLQLMCQTDAHLAKEGICCRRRCTHPLLPRGVIQVKIHELLSSGVIGNSDALVLSAAVLQGREQQHLSWVLVSKKRPPTALL